MDLISAGVRESASGHDRSGDSSAVQAIYSGAASIASGGDR